MKMENTIYVIEAAGGNATAIQVLDRAQQRDWYESHGKQLAERTAPYAVEQAGFLIPNARHLEMSGGEFCGNAARSAALLLATRLGTSSLDFTMSGFDGRIEALVIWDDAQIRTAADVRCTFPRLAVTMRRIAVLNGSRQATVVDLGGIVHVLLDGELPEDYEVLHRRITEELNLSDRPAVGVCWIRHLAGDLVSLEPVVWVRAIDSFFHETSCGSGSIATGVATGKSRVRQPSGRLIIVTRDGDNVTLESHMEVTHAE